MPLLLALPLGIVLMVVLMVALWPLAIYLRLRRSGERRQLRGWMVGLQWISLLVSLLLLLLVATLAGHWWPQSLQWVLAGLAIGSGLGLLARVFARVESRPAGLYVTPAAWLGWALTALVALRLLAGLWLGTRVWLAGQAWPQTGWLSHAGLLGMGAVLLGFALGNTWWQRRECRRHRRLHGAH